MNNNASQSMSMTIDRTLHRAAHATNPNCATFGVSICRAVTDATLKRYDMIISDIGKVETDIF